MEDRKGRMVSGASVCPMNMLAATFRDSAPLAPINRVITLANARTSKLHDPQVVENGEKSGNENDCGQNLKGEGRHCIARRTELAKNKRGAEPGKSKQLGDFLSNPSEGRLAGRSFQHQQGEHKLKAQSPDDGFDPYLFAIG